MFIVFSIFIPFIFIFLSNILSYRFLSNEEKSSSFECGYFELTDHRLSFSIQFFLFCIIFLVFDVEVSFLLPLPLFSIYFFKTLLGIFIFLFLLFLGMYFEWFKGIFDWSH